ncbi:lysozyme protein (macronuclear) [Tetrahymena thermophila SB210]|uniref:Lysozyme protein n=1 Tax=Tetrahymena thermophila (strain SB210) TaxID=312017 RepID=Q237A7_TETTS|nr:lysozyme protein [Tetrahymena thermophila SB210]EAR92343.2 lysozyme protein [Tetrahymena thermophila SB210]|eukprot:XP_001012588.2 lysozyme protein [Tetrahymena thermophila SB210]
MNKLLVASLTILLITSFARAQKGILGFTPQYSGYSQDKYLCMKNSQNEFKYQNLVEKQIWGYDRYHKTGQNYADNVGLSTNSIYVPCININAAEFPYFSQENQLFTFLKYFQQNHDVFKGDFLWVSIEQNQSKNCQWHNDFNINCSVLEEIMNQVRRSFVGVGNIGIMTSKQDWEALFGNKCNKYSSYPLHYKNYDNKPNFSDWIQQKFGGWTKPSMKTYSKGKYECYMEAELTVIISCFLILLVASSVYSQSRIAFYDLLDYEENMYQCLKFYKVSTQLVDGFKDNTTIFSPQVQGKIDRAQEQGISTDLLFDPCVNTVRQENFYTPEHQVTKFSENYKFLTGYENIWFNVIQKADRNCFWSTDANLNCEILTKYISLLQAQTGKKIGIRSSSLDWSNIFGTTTNCANFGNLPLSYINYNQKPNFQDWQDQQFGSWRGPMMKEFDTTELCGLTTTLSVY